MYILPQLFKTEEKIKEKRKIYNWNKILTVGGSQTPACQQKLLRVSLQILSLWDDGQLVSQVLHLERKQKEQWE